MSFRSVIRGVASQCGLLIILAGLASAASLCDLNQDGSINVVDVQLITNMMLGVAPCTANVSGSAVCTDPVRTVVLNGVFGGGCHSVFLSWTASTSSGIVGYNVYRSTSAGGPYTKVNSTPVAATVYVDSTVAAGQTYYYSATAVDGSGNESQKTSAITAAVPSAAS